MERPTKKVLVVENDEIVLQLISYLLTRESYVVHTTVDGLEADEMLRSTAYDAILLDLKMPHGGADLIRKLEQQNPSLLGRIIVVTGAIEEAAKLEKDRIHAIVKKPFEIEALLNTVRACVSRPS